MTRIPKGLGIVLTVVVLAGGLWPSTAYAQRRGIVRGGVVFVGGYFYDPFFGPYPWWGPEFYPYPYYPVYDVRAKVRVLAKPKDAAVYVDGYFAGVVDDFDGVFQRLPLPPGSHDLVLYREGYRTVHQRLQLRRGTTYKVRYTMEHLAAGQTSEAPPTVPAVPSPPPGSATTPRAAPPYGPRVGAPMPVPGRAPIAPRTAGYGSLAIRVQPRDAEVTIDGERWNVSDGSERLTVELSVGRHLVEVQKTGYRPFSAQIEVRPAITTPLNVSLSSENPQ